MSTIHNDAYKGSLTASRLARYLESDVTALSALEVVAGGPQTPLSPLALAVCAGNLDTVTLLLKKSPSLDVELGSSIYTPLYYAITRSPPATRVAIVNALLDAKADIKSCSKDEDDFTPLMFVISRTRDAELIHIFLDRNTKLNLKEERGGLTAETLAKEAGLEKELLPKDKRSAGQGELVYYIFAVAMVVYLYAKAAFGGLIKEVLAIPQVKSVVKVATDKFHADVAIALAELGQKLEKGSTVLLDMQKQTKNAGGGTPTTNAGTTKPPSSKTKPSKSTSKSTKAPSTTSGRRDSSRASTKATPSPLSSPPQLAPASLS